MKVSEIVMESMLTCPDCGHSKVEIMPTDCCQWYYECMFCHTVMKPLPGDCCVYCSFGSVNCPPKQAGQRCNQASDA